MDIQLKPEIVLRISILITIFLLIVIMPVSAANNTIINRSATIFIGEGGLDVTHALNEASGFGPVDTVPTNTTIGWWVPGTDIDSLAPVKTLDLVANNRVADMVVVPADFVGYYGKWYLYNSDISVSSTRLVFSVVDPSLSLAVWDFDQSTDMTGRSVPQGVPLGFRIDTNMYPAVDTRYRSPVNPATDGYINIKLKDENGVRITDLRVGNSTDGGIPITNVSTLRQFVDFQPWFFGNASMYWVNDAIGANNQSIYPVGTYTVWAESTLNHMKDYYKNAGADYTGKTISQTVTITIVYDSARLEANKNSVVRGKPFSVTVTGRPGKTYYLWVKGTNSMNSGFNNQPPMILAGNEKVYFDPAVGILNNGDYPIGQYQYENGAGATIRSDVATAPDVLAPSYNSTRYYALINTSTSGTRTIEWVTNNWTRAQKYTFRVEQHFPTDTSGLGAPYEGTGIIRSDEVDVIVVNGTITIASTHDKEFTLGEELRFFGINTGSYVTYLYLTGQGLPPGGAQIVSSDPKNHPIVNGNYSTFKRVDVNGDNTWSWKWNTTGVSLEPGNYKVIAVGEPYDAQHQANESSWYGSVPLIHVVSPTWTVGPSGCNFTSIQEAVDNANNGDNIFVNSGSYYETVTINKSLTLRGVDSGYGKPIVDVRGGQTGIRISADNCTVDGFVIRNAYLSYPEGAGVRISASNHTTLTNNTFSHNRMGIYLDYPRSNSHLFQGNVFEGDDGGIRISCGDFITVRNNVLRSNWGKISLDNSNQNEISDNTIENTQGTAVSLDYSNYNWISENRLRSNNRGISISLDSTSTVIINNTLEVNSVGFDIQGSNTTLALNNFIENAQQGTISGSSVYLNSTNKVSYTYQSRVYNQFTGNYWSDFRDTESNNDGIWDNSRTIGSGIDYAPLVGRWNGIAISQPIPPSVLTVCSAGCNFTHIQDAISNATTGDLIQIFSGNYPEQIVLKKTLTIRGIDTGGGQPQIKPKPSTGSVPPGAAITLHTGLIKISNVNISGFSVGIALQSNGNIIENSTIMTLDQGLSLSSAFDNKLINNSIRKMQMSGYYESGGSGISLSSSSRNTIANNTIQYWTWGMYSTYSNNNVIVSNHNLNNQDTGIFISNNMNCQISHNIIEQNQRGIVLSSWNSPPGNNITENIIANNTNSGISVLGDSVYDLIYLNTFNNNKNSDPQSDVISTWNSLTPHQYTFRNATFTNYLGNYWSDYTGTDANGDGIGDTPYVAVTDPDNYPLMGAWNGTAITTERPQPITPAPLPTPIPTPIPPPKPWGILNLPNATVPNQTTKLIPIYICLFSDVASGVSFDLVYNQSVIQVKGFVPSDAVPGSSIIANIDNNNGKASVALTNVLGIEQTLFGPRVLLFINSTAVGDVNESTLILAQGVTASDQQFAIHNLTVENGWVTIVVDVKGDFNHNGRVDIGDVAKVSYMVVNQEPKLIPDADFNHNGQVDIGDAAKIAYYLVGRVSGL